MSVDPDDWVLATLAALTDRVEKLESATWRLKEEAAFRKDEATFRDEWEASR